MARAKCRVVSGSTPSSIAPSRRWRCQSSGRRRVRLWVMPAAYCKGRAFSSESRKPPPLATLVADRGPALDPGGAARHLRPMTGVPP
ncbi:hypothetical protein RSP03_15060 [Cereibacter sphaeroides]|nr:hypothetical protein RSP03_15060 [Cereibacter sphaeroides]